MLVTYKLPVAKIAHTDIFCLFGICNLAITGIGSTKVKTSMMMLKTESAMYFIDWSIQVAAGSKRRSQVAAKGLQPKMLIKL